MSTIHKKVIEGSWCEGMRYENIIYKNGLLIIKQTPFNSKSLINNLIDSYKRLEKEYKMKKDMRRQKIISKLNSNSKEYILIQEEKVNNTQSSVTTKSKVKDLKTKEYRKEENEQKEIKYKYLGKTTLMMTRSIEVIKNTES